MNMSIYFSDGQRVELYRHNVGRESGYPMSLEDEFGGIRAPSFVTAAVADQETSTLYLMEYNQTTSATVGMIYRYGGPPDELQYNYIKTVTFSSQLKNNPFQANVSVSEMNHPPPRVSALVMGYNDFQERVMAAFSGNHLYTFLTTDNATFTSGEWEDVGEMELPGCIKPEPTPAPEPTPPPPSPTTPAAPTPEPEPTPPPPSPATPAAPTPEPEPTLSPRPPPPTLSPSPPPPTPPVPSPEPTLSPRPPPPTLSPSPPPPTPPVPTPK